MVNDVELHKRKEPRFRTCEDDGLKCLLFVDVNDPLSGTVIDVSPSGLRLLCEGRPEVGEAFLTELTSDRLHGVFPGIVRRVTPWVDGKYVLGCQLLESIPAEVLETLAGESVINRRGGDRVEWRQPATLTWELNSQDAEVEIRDCSRGGLKVYSKTRLPIDSNVRILISMDSDEDMILEGVTVWESEPDEKDTEGYCYGIAFTRREVPKVIRQVMGEPDPDAELPPKPKRKHKIVSIDDEPILSQCLLVMAAIVVLTVGVLQSGILN